MIPSKPEKSSRRSSILKLPKARQPFQTVEANGSLVEDSPVKIKRRVSFAEKKHVKEFCDSMEQGTVWDSTYEENELSQTRSNSHTNTDDNPQHSQISSNVLNASNNQFPIRETDNHSLNTFDPNSNNNNHHHHQSKKVLVRQDAVDLDYLPIEAIRSRLAPGDISNVLISANPELLANKENIPAVLEFESRVESSLIEDTEITIVTKKLNNITPHGFSVYCDENMENENEDNLMNKTDHQDLSMDCTLPVTDSMLLSHSNNSVNINAINNPIVRTEITGVPPDNLMETENRTSVFHNKSMEMTEAVPASCFAIQKSNVMANDTMEMTEAVSSRRPRQLLFEDGTQYFHDKSMEMTAAVSSRCSGQFPDNQTQVFQNKSMEMTEAVPSGRSRQCPVNQTQVFQNKSMEMTKAVPARHARQLFDDQTQFFHNKSMEMTAAVSSVRPGQFPDDQTQVFQNKSMEMTEAVPTRRPRQLLEDGTQYFHNKSMEMTAAVSSVRSGQFPDNQTQVFQNKSMEMTEAVPMRRPGRLLEDGTQYFHNKSMEMTAAVSSVRPGQFPDNQTQVFQNKSMEMTEAVPTRRPGRLLEDGTQYFHNKSMEMTAAVSSVRPGQFPDNQTQVFQNKSMEMTEAVPMRRPGRLLEDGTQYFHNKSMEMTAAVSSVRSGQFPDNQTQVFQNKSMEITEAVPPRRPRQLFEDQTQFFHNKSMEMTETVIQGRFSVTTLQHNNPGQSNNITDTQKILQNFCMERTEVIPSLKRQYQQISNENKTDSELSSPSAKNLRDNFTTQKRQVSAEDAEALHRFLHSNLDQTDGDSILPSRNLSICQNQSMEMTTAVPAHLTISKNNEKNLSPLNISMEMTEVVPSFASKSQTTIVSTDEIIAPELDKLSEDSDEEKSPEVTPNINYSMEQLLFEDKLASQETPSRNYSMKQFFMEEISKSHEKTPDKNYSMEQLRIRANSASKFSNENISYDITAPIENPNNNCLNYLENIEAPSFVYQDTTDEVSESKIEELDRIEHPRRTYVITRNESEKSGEIVLPNANSDVEVCSEPSQNKICDRDNLNEQEFIVNDGKERAILQSEIKETNPIVSELSPEKIGKLPQLMLQKYVATPIKKIDLKLKILKENDFLVTRIDKQRRKMNEARERRNARALEIKLKLENVEPVASTAEENIESRYDILVKNLNEISSRDNCIWIVHSATPKTICIEYTMTAVLLGIVFSVPDHPNELEKLERVRIISRMSDEEPAIIRMADRLIEKIDLESLKKNYKTYDDVLQLIEHVTEEINLVYDFYHELKKLSCLNSMVVEVDKVSFRVWTKQMNIILNISMNIKPFSEIQPEDIDVSCLLGSVRINDVKNLIKNVKRTYKFLTLYINDIKDYIELMEMSTAGRK